MHLFLRGLGLSSDFEKIQEELEALPDTPKIRISNLVAAPTLPELLNRVVQELEESPPYKGALLGQPGGKNVDRTFLIRTLLAFNRERYGSPLWEVIQLTVEALQGLKPGAVTIDLLRNTQKSN